MKTKKNRGVVYLPPEKNQNRNHFVFLSFGVDPLNWQSFIEIGEMACSTTDRCSRGHTPKLILYNEISLSVKFQDYFSHIWEHSRFIIQTVIKQTLLHKEALLGKNKIMYSAFF